MAVQVHLQPTGIGTLCRGIAEFQGVAMLAAAIDAQIGERHLHRRQPLPGEHHHPLQLELAAVGQKRQ